MDSFGIGASVVRREDLRLITGTGCYADDVQIDGALERLNQPNTLFDE